MISSIALSRELINFWLPGLEGFTKTPVHTINTSLSDVYAFIDFMQIHIR